MVVFFSKHVKQSTFSTTILGHDKHQLNHFRPTTMPEEYWLTSSTLAQPPLSLTMLPSCTIFPLSKPRWPLSLSFIFLVLTILTAMLSHTCCCSPPQPTTSTAPHAQWPLVLSHSEPWALLTYLLNITCINSGTLGHNPFRLGMSSKSPKPIGLCTWQLAVTFHCWFLGIIYEVNCLWLYTNLLSRSCNFY